MVPQLLANGLIAGATYALIAVGVSLTYGPRRFFDLTLGGFYTLGAYTLFVVHSRVGLAGGLVVASAVTGLLGWGVDVTVFRYLRRKRATQLIMMLMSFGLLLTLQSTAALVFSNNTQTVSASGVSVSLTILGASVTRPQLVIVLVCAIAVAATAAALNTRRGRQTAAVATDPIGASVVGIDAERVVTLTYAVGSALVGLAGALIARETNIEPTMGFNMILKGMIAAVLGGVGSIVGAVLGGIGIGFAENAGVWFLGSDWRDAVTFALLILALLAVPSRWLYERGHRDS